MALVCPICKSPAQELARSDDATGFYCTIYGHFKVANRIAVDEYYTRAEWEAALRAAKYKAMEGEWPVMRPGDFFRERERVWVAQSKENLPTPSVQLTTSTNNRELAH
jgi:hypothetical protein